MQQNSRFRLCGNRDETINHIISKCCKLTQREYKTRHNRMGKVILWELCKKLKFNHTNKWYIHNPESALENEIHKILWNFEIQIGLLILANQPDQQKKENQLNSGLCHSAWPQGKTEGKQKNTLTLLEKWKNYGAWKLLGYQLQLVCLVQSPKDWYRDLRTWE